jgi:hypothetical protein
MLGSDGVEIKRRTHHFKTYKNCFVGVEAVTWLSEKLEISRETAVTVGSELVSRGYFRHVSKHHAFLDKSHLYTCSKGECLNTCTIWTKGI